MSDSNVTPDPPPGPDRDPRSAEQLVERAFAILNADPAAARDLAEAAREAALASAAPGLAGQARHAQGMAECVLGRVADGAASLRAAADELNRHGPAVAECRALRDLGAVLVNLTGDGPGGLAALERARALAESDGDRWEQGLVHARLGPLFGRLGQLDEAETAMRLAVELLAGGPDPTARPNAMVNLGYVHLQRGNFAAALPLFLEAREGLHADADRLRRLNCDANLAVALAGVGRLADARALLEQMRPRLDPAMDAYQWADHLLTAGRVCLIGGDPRAARTHLREALDYARVRGLRAAEIEILERLCEAEEGCGDFRAALAGERLLRTAERRWLDEQTAERVRVLKAGVELAEKRAENAALERVRGELEQRVAERTQALQLQVQERRAAEELARFWAEHDWLTKLPNRHRLQAVLSAELARARRDARPLGVLFVDLDGFKAINDAHGHLAGDRMLRATARRLQRAVPTEATVTRFGGDEFVVLLPGLDRTGRAGEVAEQLRKAVLAPLKLAGRRVSLSCSIGVAIGPGAARGADELVRQADRAMLVAKASGRNQVCTLDEQGQQRMDRRGQLGRDLGQAIDSNGLTAVFQPLVRVPGGQLDGVELLSRWKHPELGPVSPAEFIPLAEEMGLIGALGLWTLRQAVRACAVLRERSGRALRVSINLSTVQLSDADLIERLSDTVMAEGGDPRWIELELTESVRLAEDPACLERLRRLREIGFHLAIDDFGSGYSSFNYLSRAYFDRLKIDRALVHSAGVRSERSAVTGSIIAMAHALGLRVVAEGIETAEQQALLMVQGCDVMQGFHLGRPMPLDELLAWWDGHEPRRP